MEFSNSIKKLQKLILVSEVVRVDIYEQKKNRKIISITKTIHI